MKGFRPWRGRRRRYDDLAVSMREHLEEKAEELIDQGMPPAEAWLAAQRAFGNPLQIAERSREVWQWTAFESLLADVRLALRQVRRAPGFVLTVCLTLALGIGATTAIFTLVQQVMLRSLPVEQPGQLWRIGDSANCCHSNGYTQRNPSTRNDWSLFSWQAYRQFRANTSAFEDLAAFEIGEANAELAVRRAGSRAAVQPANGEYVSGNFFHTLGVRAWRGRLFTEADDRQGAPPVAVISFHTWQKKFGADPSVVGSALEINGHAFTVAGITPPGFYGAKIAVWGMPGIWLPLATEPLIAGATSRLKNPASAWLDLIGRVRPGTNPQALQAQLQGELQGWLASHLPEMTARERELWRRQKLVLTPGGAGVSLMRVNYREGLRLLAVAALCVLLLACANLANLLLARGLRNRRQTAVRVALGAGRARLVRKALVESVVLALMGGAAGVGVAWMGARLILHLAYTRSPQSAWIPVHASPSLPVLLFALGISVATGIAFGVIPAWITSRADPMEAMKGTSSMPAGEPHRLRKMLVIVQVALSMVLLAAAAMLGQSLRNHEHQGFGFSPNGRYLVSVDPKLSNIPEAQLAPLFQQIEARLRAIPGVRRVGAVLEAPPGGWITHDIRIEGRPEPRPGADTLSGWTRVTPGFFPAYGDRIIAGRAITRDDTAATRPVAVVNEAFARKFFGGENPVGQHFGPAPGRNAGMYEIVGVAANVTFEGRRRRPMYFLPEAQSTHFADAGTERREVWSHYLYNLVLWAPGNPPGLEARVKQALAQVDPDLMVYGMQSYRDVIHGDFAQQTMLATLALLFGALGLVLAAVGLYGVTAYGVEQRTAEIGVRMALGANRASVIRMVLRAAFAPVAMGLAVGIPAAVGAGWLMASQLYGVRPWNPLLLAAAAALMTVAAPLAAVIPARRAASVDPMHALRAE